MHLQFPLKNVFFYWMSFNILPNPLRRCNCGNHDREIIVDDEMVVFAVGVVSRFGNICFRNNIS